MASRLPSSLGQHLRQQTLLHPRPPQSSPRLLLLLPLTKTRRPGPPQQPYAVRTLHTSPATHGEKRGWMVAPRGWNTRPPRQSWHVQHDTAHNPNLPALATGPAAALKRKHNSTPPRCGVLAIKKGMTAVYQHGRRLPCTVLQLDGCTVVANKTFEKHGYWAVQMGMGEKRAITVKHPQLGYFEAKGLRPMRHLAEFRVRGPEGLLPVGSELWPDWFHKGQYVDARSNSRGMGFAGGMKRHGFKGQAKTHGVSLTHRAIGSAGPSQGGGSRVHPGKKMPGRMGNERVTVQNLQVLVVNNDLGTVMVKGAVAGPKGCLVKIQDAVKKRGPYISHAKEMREKLDERYPHAARHLYEARKMHMKLKRLRKHGQIMKAIEKAERAGEEVAEKSGIAGPSKKAKDAVATGAMLAAQQQQSASGTENVTAV